MARATLTVLVLCIISLQFFSDARTLDEKVKQRREVIISAQEKAIAEARKGFRKSRDLSSFSAILVPGGLFSDVITQYEENLHREEISDYTVQSEFYDGLGELYAALYVGTPSTPYFVQVSTAQSDLILYSDSCDTCPYYSGVYDPLGSSSFSSEICASGRPRCVYTGLDRQAPKTGSFVANQTMYQNHLASFAQTILDKEGSSLMGTVGTDYFDIAPYEYTQDSFEEALDMGNQEDQFPGPSILQRDINGRDIDSPRTEFGLADVHMSENPSALASLFENDPELLSYLQQNGIAKSGHWGLGDVSHSALGSERTAYDNLINYYDLYNSFSICILNQQPEGQQLGETVLVQGMGTMDIGVDYSGDYSFEWYQQSGDLYTPELTKIQLFAETGNCCKFFSQSSQSAFCNCEGPSYFESDQGGRRSLPITTNALNMHSESTTMLDTSRFEISLNAPSFEIMLDYIKEVTDPALGDDVFGNLASVIENGCGCLPVYEDFTEAGYPSISFTFNRDEIVQPLKRSTENSKKDFIEYDDDGLLYTVKADQWLYAYGQCDNKEYYVCSAIKKSKQNEGTVLGTVFMQNYHVVFDREQHRIGFGPSADDGYESCPLFEELNSGSDPCAVLIGNYPDWIACCIDNQASHYPSCTA